MPESCIFCRIVRGEIPATRVYETDDAIAFRDVNPQAPVHILVVPRIHATGLTDLPAFDATWNALIALVQRVAHLENLGSGFRVVINQGQIGGQTVEHLHLHILAGRQMTWPPG
jgi:histidine triad (HIT) family protein